MLLEEGDLASSKDLTDMDDDVEEPELMTA